MSRRWIFSLPMILLAAASSFAVAPHPDVIETMKRDGSLEKHFDLLNKYRAEGLCAPNETPVWRPDRTNRPLSAQAGPDTVNVCVILVDFSDNVWSGGVNSDWADFDSILFSDSTIDTAGAIINPTGSMTDYYMEVSYGQFYLKGDIFGPFRAPNTYASYVGSDDGLSGSRQLVSWLVQTYDGIIDFSQYSRDGYACDGLIVIHAGTGAEEGGGGIWSHKWTIPSSLLLDGVWVTNYTMNPEETNQGIGGLSLSSIGVFCHEYGHFLGLPDLYDVEYNEGSSGCGRWTLMASGNYNGDSRRPAHMDAWCKAEVGFVDVIDVTENLHQAEIPAVEWNPVVYRLQNLATGPNEYWLVENRTRSGFDFSLPGEGLCIWHIDHATAVGEGSNQAPPYRVALEQADGAFQLEYSDGQGDAGDVWPGASNNRDFHDYSFPASCLNTNLGPDYGEPSAIGVRDISDQDSVMYADLDIEHSRPFILPGAPMGGDAFIFNDDAPRGDGDGLPEAGETIHFFAWVFNLERGSYNVRASLSNKSDGVIYETPMVSFNKDLLGVAVSNTDPIVFHVADTLTTVIDSFFVTIITDSLPGNTFGSEFVTTFGIEQQIGATQVLLVDADGGAAYQQEYVDALRGLRIPTHVWNRATQGSPAAANLTGYTSVFWHTGAQITTPLFTVADVAAMKGYMDAGGNLFLATLDANGLAALDATFAQDYFKYAYEESEFWFTMLGVEGSTIGTDTKYFLQAGILAGNPPIKHLTVQSGGEVCFKSGKTGVNRTWGISHDGGTYKSVIITLPPELYNDNAAGYQPKDTLIARVLAYFGGMATDVYDGSSFGQLPKSFELTQNYPNPFNPTTTIQYTLHSTGEAGDQIPPTRLVVYNMLGQEVTTLINKVQIPGTYQVEWDGSDRFGKKVASGVYFYRLERGDEAQSMKMILIK